MLSRGGFPSIHPCEIRDITASLLSEVCSDVGVEPALQPLDHEPLQYATTNREDGACLDVVARDLLGKRALGCLILLHAPILVSHCQDATRYMNRRKDKHIMKEFRRWRELAFPLLLEA